MTGQRCRLAVSDGVGEFVVEGLGVWFEFQGVTTGEFYYAQVLAGEALELFDGGGVIDYAVLLGED